MAFSREAYDKSDRPSVLFPVPALNGQEARIRPMPAALAVALADKVYTQAESIFHVVQQCLIDDDGKTLFGLDEIDLLKQRDFLPLSQIAAEAVRISKGSDEKNG